VLEKSKTPKLPPKLLRKGKKLPSKPLDEKRRRLLSTVKPIDLTYVDMTNGFKKHPHKGAQDEKGNWGYVHDETTLRRNPPPFKLETLKEECDKRDDHYKMLTEKVFVDGGTQCGGKERKKTRQALLFGLHKQERPRGHSIPSTNVGVSAPIDKLVLTHHSFLTL
jgi:hypothetical protein